jgi:hypothetical protein
MEHCSEFVGCGVVGFIVIVVEFLCWRGELFDYFGLFIKYRFEFYEG